MQLTIKEVKRGPQAGGSFGEDSQFGATYVTEWLCSANGSDGTQYENIKVRIGAKSAGTSPPNGKYVAPGGIIVPNKQGIKEYPEDSGKFEVYADAGSTKDANGDAYQGGGGGSSSGGGGGGGYAAPSSAQYSTEDLLALYEWCYNEAIGVIGSDMSDDSIIAATATLFIQATRSGCRATPPATKQEETRAAPPPPDEYRGDDSGEADEDSLPF